ncbi:hypothetical protein [Corynebacterium aquilae]|uniref:hypothetical protein n=1 Tax=Corynebacterium aquilae TaxID=203263 RepID=UPI0012EDBCB4|nr:hypothetical protein [Corynebacterium aquilae]
MAEEVSSLKPRMIGLQTVRSSISNIDTVNEAEGLPETIDPDFSISVFYDPESPENTLVVGEIVAVYRDLLAGVSMSSTIEIDPRAQVTERQALAIGYWAAHLLYDSTSAAWRNLTSGNYFFSTFSLPQSPNTST